MNLPLGVFHYISFLCNTTTHKVHMVVCRRVSVSKWVNEQMTVSVRVCVCVPQCLSPSSRNLRLSPYNCSNSEQKWSMFDPSLYSLSKTANCCTSTGLSLLRSYTHTQKETLQITNTPTIFLLYSSFTCRPSSIIPLPQIPTSYLCSFVVFIVGPSFGAISSSFWLFCSENIDLICLHTACMVCLAGCILNPAL